ncbi:MAG: hypothetical protein SGPRY_005489 [Prymnesium sp.]
MVDVLKHLFKYTKVALAFSTGQYGEEAADAFSEAALVAGVAISVTLSFRPNVDDLSSQQATLLKSRSRVIVLFAQAAAGARFIQAAELAGAAGEGFLYLLSDATVCEKRFWHGSQQRSLRGSFMLVLDDRRGSAQHTAFLARRQHWLRRAFPDGSCSQERDDDDSAYLWGQYREGSSHFECAPHDEGGHDAFGCDAVFSVAHALHDLLEVQGRDLVGSNLLDSLLSRVSFDGLTGPVDFQNSSAGTGQLYTGDRGNVISYELLNYVNNQLPHVAIGRWSTCATSTCAWSERWREASQPLTFSTEDNSKPPQQASCYYGSVLSREGLCICDEGFEASANERQCVPCPAFTSSAGGGSPCDVCAVGRYLVPGLIPSSDNCKACPTGAECGWNTTLATLQRGGAGCAVVLSEVSSAIAVCKVCLVDNHYFRDGSCRECPDTGTSVGVSFGICFGLLLPIFALYVLHEQTGEMLAFFSVPLRRRTLGLKEFVKRLGLVSKLKLALTFAQVIAALEGTYAVWMSPSWFEWTAFIRFWGDLNWADWVVPSDCLVTSTLRLLLLRALIPLAVVVATPLIGAMISVVKSSYSVEKLASRQSRRGRSPLERQIEGEGQLHPAPPDPSDRPSASSPSPSISWASSTASVSNERHPNGQPTVKRAAAAGALEFLPVSLVLAFCFTPSVSVSIFSVWKCLAYEFDQTEEYRYLASDLSIRCDGDFSEEFNQLTTAAWFLVGIWPIGMAVSYGLLLVQSHKLLRKENFWWEVLSLLQRTTLTGWLLLLDSKLSFIRLLAAQIVIIAFLVVLLALKPYKRQLDYTMAAGCQILFVCIFTCGIIVKLYEDISTDTNGSAALAYRFLGLHSSEEVIVIMILVAVAMLLLLAFTLASESYAYILQRRLAQQFLVCTMDPPFIDWRPHGIYACFLSHYKAGL